MDQKLASNLDRFKKELDELILLGKGILASLCDELEQKYENKSKKAQKKDLPSFQLNYERWYSVSMQVIKQLLPDRLNDFNRLYRDEKRREIDYLTYGIADYMLGLQTSRNGKVIADGKAALPKFIQQLDILSSAKSRLESSLFDMKEIVQADLFDSELDSAKGLSKKGFYRAAGAVAGVVVEKHLKNVCQNHGASMKKKDPTINDLNQALKDADVIDVPTWRKIQHLGDIRNLCDHAKDKEPTKDDIEDLLSGVSKIIKTLF
ncbi:MAG: HEPN domain-containing protein [Candidatus Margulisiibacteriota bacterium]